MKRLEQLKKIKMPAKPMGEKEAEMDLDMELGAEDAEMPAEPKMPGMQEEQDDEMAEMAPEEELFKDIDDDMLVAEMKKRGLTLDDKPAEEEESEEDMPA